MTDYSVVKSEFEKNGIEENRFNLQAVGATEPIGDNSNEIGRKRNRRVDISITIFSVTPAKKYQNIQELYRDLGIKYQNFKINTAKDTIIKGEKGTVLFIPKAAFEGMPANATIDFRLKEAYSFSDIISENLSTQSGNKLLQTGGMIYIDAKYNGNNLTLKKEMNVAFSSKESQQEGMQLFRGERDMKNNGNINWNPLDKEGFEEEVILYKKENELEPSYIKDKEGYIKFKDILDTAGCAKLFKSKLAKTDIKSISLNNLNKTQMAMVFAARANPSLVEVSIEQLHHYTFKETYDFYKVKSYSEMNKLKGESWDSLMAVRMTFVEQQAVSQENWQKALIRRKQIEDSLKIVFEREYAIWYEANKDSIETARKRSKDFQRIFPVNYLGWFNCDRYAQFDLTSLLIDIPESESFNIIFLVKRENLAVNSVTDNGKARLVVPKNIKGTLISMKMLKGEPFIATLDMNTSIESINLEYKPTTAEEMKLKFRALNNR